MDSLSGTEGIVAVAAAGTAALSLLVSAVLGYRLRAVRRAQRAVLGTEDHDLVAHAEKLQREFALLSAGVEDAAEKLNARMATAEQRLDGTIAYRALVRYDAYNEMSGRQSTSIALLDATRSGVVLSAIHHREQSRLYAKQVLNGEGELELSPEELEAVSLAISSGHGAAPPAA